MRISRFLLLTFTAMVAIFIPGCSSKSDLSWLSTTTTTTTIQPYSQEQFDEIKNNLTTLTTDPLFVEELRKYLYQSLEKYLRGRFELRNLHADTKIKVEQFSG
jgi:hypothetical protein